MKKGFTLIEICVVVGILLLIVGLALPSFNRILASHRLDKEAHHLALILTQARQMAFHNKEEVMVLLDVRTNGVHVRSKSGKEFSKVLDRSLKIEATTSTFLFGAETLPSRQEIRLIAKNGSFRQLTVEPFLKHVQVQ